MQNPIWKDIRLMMLNLNSFFGIMLYLKSSGNLSSLADWQFNMLPNRISKILIKIHDVMTYFMIGASNIQ